MLNVKYDIGELVNTISTHGIVIADIPECYAIGDNFYCEQVIELLDSEGLSSCPDESHYENTLHTLICSTDTNELLVINGMIKAIEDFIYHFELK